MPLAFLRGGDAPAGNSRLEIATDCQSSRNRPITPTQAKGAGNGGEPPWAIRDGHPLPDVTRAETARLPAAAGGQFETDSFYWL